MAQIVLRIRAAGSCRSVYLQASIRKLSAGGSCTSSSTLHHHHHHHHHDEIMSAHEHNASQDYYNGTSWYYTECTLNLNTDYRRIALFLLYLFIFVVGLLENLLVIWVNWRRRHSASGVLFCIINVTLSDLMVIVILPFFMMEVTMEKVWLWGRFLCKVTNLIYVVNFYSSSFFLALMTLERYLSLTRPSAPAILPVGRQRWLVCGGLWVFALFLGLMENVHMELLEWNEPGCYMVPEHDAIEWYIAVAFLCNIFQFLGPGAIIITCNVLIARAVQTMPHVEGRRDVWLMHVYSLVFVMCWLPFHMVALLMTIEDLNTLLFSCNMVDAIYFSLSVVHCISLFHCIANPILYNFLSKSFQNNLINTVVSHLPKAGPADQMEGKAGGLNGGDLEKRRKISNASTSQSDIGS